MAWAGLTASSRIPSEWTGFLEQGVKLEGKLEATGTFRIDSRDEGNPRLRRHADPRRARRRRRRDPRQSRDHRRPLRRDHPARAAKWKSSRMPSLPAKFTRRAWSSSPAQFSTANATCSRPTEAAKPITIPIRSRRPILALTDSLLQNNLGSAWGTRCLSRSVPSACGESSNGTYSTTMRRNFFLPGAQQKFAGFDRSISRFTSSTR